METLFEALFELITEIVSGICEDVLKDQSRSRSVRIAAFTVMAVLFLGLCAVLAVPGILCFRSIRWRGGSWWASRLCSGFLRSER